MQPHLLKKDIFSIKKDTFLGRWLSRHGNEKRLPGLDLSPRQLFWTAAANIWCFKYRPKALKQAIRTGVHSPGRFRVLGPLSNSREFAEDFSTYT